MISAMTGGIFFISALRDCVSLKSVKIKYMDLIGYESGEIFEVLRVHQPQLERLEYPGNIFTRRYSQCKWVLADLLRDLNRLHTLDISCNCIDDSTLEALIPSLGKLRRLDLSLNGSLGLLTTKAFESLATLLEDDASSLEELSLEQINIRDDRVHIFARAISNNRKLRVLNLRRNNISESGWMTFFSSLCDTSTVNNTYLSNHILEQLIVIRRIVDMVHNERLPWILQFCLDLN